ncbi:MAG: PQQ-binding-like beta-propeller repeat protein [Caulobacterales bacterium]|nr:PQQ-binding-like beta-propeller repeat protein [Caulobacterales bacterium]
MKSDLARVGLAALMVCLGGAPAAWSQGAPPDGEPVEARSVVTDAMLVDPPAEDWLMFRGNHQSWGYSALDQIDRETAPELRLAWAVGMDPGSNQTTPLVHDGVLYLAHPNDVITAHDAMTGDRIWEYKHELTAEPWGSGGITRNIAIYNGKLFHSAGDARVIALDSATGALVWDASVGDPAIITHSSGPIVAGGRVFTGRVCRYKPPARCFVTAHDAESGEELWRTQVIPKPGEPGDESWAGTPYEQRVHGSVWMVGSYDTELDTLYWGTSGPSPAPEVMRGGVAADMLYTNSTLALDPATGAIKWHVQHLPRDNWDTDHPYERILVDAEVRPDSDAVWRQSPNLPTGEQKLLTGIPGKTGIVWTMDRRTGEFYWAKQTIFQNIVSDIDPESGRVTINEDVVFSEIEGEPILVCPSLAGGRDWPAGSYDPRRKTMFMPMMNICMNVSASPDDPRYGLKPQLLRTPGEERVGRLEAIHVETGETRWVHETAHGVLSVLATGGDLLFAGDSQRRFRAYDLDTGNILWERILGGPVTGFPISYAVDGEQYVAVAVGGGGGAIGAWTFIAGDRTTRQGGNTLYVFKLPETSPED